jgi:hypothetical protein
MEMGFGGMDRNTQRNATKLKQNSNPQSEVESIS